MTRLPALLQALHQLGRPLLVEEGTQQGSGDGLGAGCHARCGEERCKEAHPAVRVVRLGDGARIDTGEETLERVRVQAGERALPGVGVDGVVQVGIRAEELHAPPHPIDGKGRVFVVKDEGHEGGHWTHEVGRHRFDGLVQNVLPCVGRNVGVALHRLLQFLHGALDVGMVVRHPLGAGLPEAAHLQSCPVSQHLLQEVPEGIGHGTIVPVVGAVGAVGRIGLTEAIVQGAGQGTWHSGGRR